MVLAGVAPRPPRFVEHRMHGFGCPCMPVAVPHYDDAGRYVGMVVVHRGGGEPVYASARAPR
jgi:hypothetical protein